MTEPIILRLEPGDDLRIALETRARESDSAWFVTGGIGSLRTAAIRYAGATEPEVSEGPFELVSLSGTVCVDGAHLHAVIADAAGAVRAGHICAGCVVATTAELAMLTVTDQRLSREFDAETGYKELRIGSAND